ncbi:MAG: RNA methyltransferase, partial [Granulosicoccaceae bacterium]
ISEIGLMQPLNNIRIVLMNTSHPGNIGSAARAMKTMGLTELVLVNPVDYPHEQAETMAAGAVNMLERVTVVGSLLEAVSDCSVVAACSARSRGYELPTLDSRECGLRLLEVAQEGPVALVFGPERHGLSNADLQYATHRVSIDANPDYSSLNLAAAVQILCHEVRQAGLVKAEPQRQVQRIMPSAASLNHYFDRLQAVYCSTGFVNQAHPGELQKKLRHLYARAEIDQQELNMLQGMLSSVERILADPED